MNQKSKFIITSAMAGIATAACAVCMTQSAYASETDKVTDDKPAIAVTKDASNNDDMLLKTVKKSDEVKKNADAGENKDNKDVTGVVEVKNVEAKSEAKSDEKPTVAVKNVDENRGGGEKTVKNESLKDRSVEANKNENTVAKEKDGTYVLPEEGLSQKNPFSNIISNDEIDKAKDHTVAKLLFEHDGKVENIESNEDAIFGSTILNSNGVFSLYFAHKVQKDDPSNILAMSIQYLDNKIQPNGDIIASNKVDDALYKYASIKNVQINNTSVPLDKYNLNSKGSYVKLSNDIKKEGNYIFVKVDFDKTAAQYAINLSLKRDLTAQQNSYDKNLWLAPNCDAEFHYVNDMKYRKINNVNDDQHLQERSFNKDVKPNSNGTVLSSAPFKQINNIDDIHKSAISNNNKFILNTFDRNNNFRMTEPWFYNASMDSAEDDNYPHNIDFDKPLNFNNADKVPLLSFNMDNQPFVKGELQMSDFTNKTIIDPKTRTCKMPGWIYWDNDIDKPNNGVRQFANDMATVEEMGNHYRSYAYEMKDSKPVKLLTRKHYYVTYRALPTQLTVQYQGLDGKLMDAQPYAILQDGKAIQSWKSRWLSSDKKIEHKSYEDMYNFVKGKRYDIADYQVYDYNGDAYLMPGDYTIAPAIKAPDGYEWVTEKIDNAGDMLQTVKTGEGIDYVHINVLGNKNVDKNVCQYGVRFVLRKIGNKALNNVVTLSELPQKPIEKDVAAPSGNGYEMLRDLTKLPTADLSNDGSKDYVSPYELQEITFDEYKKQHNLGRAALRESDSKVYCYNVVNKTGKKSSNPYPNIISQKELNDLSNDGMIFKMYYTPQNSKISYLVYDEYDMNFAVNNGVYTIYCAVKGGKNNDGITDPIFNENPAEHKGPFPIKGGPRALTCIGPYGYGANFDSFKINNVELINHGTNKQYNFATNFNKSEFVYYKISFTVKKEDLNIGLRLVGLPFDEIDGTKSANAQFHIVDDFEYKAKNNIDPKCHLVSRNSDNIRVIDLHNFVNVNEKMNEWYDKNGYGPEHINPEFMTKDSKKLFEQIDTVRDIAPSIFTDNVAISDFDTTSPMRDCSILSFAGDGKYYKARRPSLTQLKGLNVPGYVYIDNDIDLPQNKFNIREYNLKNDTLFNSDYDRGTTGSSYLISGFPLEKDENGYVTKALTTKHYYVTFRKIPTRLIVQYKDPNGNLIDGKRYNLLQDNKALLTAKNPVLTTSRWDGYYDDFDNLKAFVQSKDYDVFGKNNVYYKDGQAYLTDGDYQIQAGVDAPEGYEWVPEVKGGDKFHIDLVKSAKDPTVKVVTMVLRKKHETKPHINIVVVPNPNPVPPTPAPVTPVPEPVNPAPQPVTPVTPVTPVPQPVTPENHDVTPIVPPVVTPVVTVPETTVPNTVQEHAKDIPVVENPDLAKLVNNTDTQKPEVHRAKADPIVSGQPAKHAKQQLPKTGAGIVMTLALGLQTMVAGVVMKLKKRK